MPSQLTTPQTATETPLISKADTRCKEYCMKKILKGESVVSLLSVLDVICGRESIFRTASLSPHYDHSTHFIVQVSARADINSTVARLRVSTFREAFHKDPGAWIRPVQIIITRLMHVTLTTLHVYLGLAPELTRPVP